jgi:two-component system, LuxR family, response regulator FixJ
MTVGSPVYLVEDDAGMRDAVSLLLRGAGFEVHSYPSAEIFLSEVDCSKSICLLTDVRLPGMDGIALFRHLVRLGTEPAVVVITGHGDIPMAVAELKDGVVDFVEKPFDPVREALQRAAANAERKAVATDIEARRSTLTARETEVLTLLMEGHLNKVIAAQPRQHDPPDQWTSGNRGREPATPIVPRSGRCRSAVHTCRFPMARFVGLGVDLHDQQQEAA